MKKMKHKQLVMKIQQLKNSSIVVRNSPKTFLGRSLFVFFVLVGIVSCKVGEDYERPKFDAISEDFYQKDSLLAQTKDTIDVA